MTTRARRVWMAIAIVLCLAASGSCAAIPDPDEAAPVSPPDRDQFIDGGVNEFIERRCGALDCHGQIGRPLRIYGGLGLRRLEDPNQPRVARPVDTTTTMEEKIDNYLSVVNLEPEAIGLSHATNAAYRDFLLLKKPLGIESEKGVRHKGGPVLRDIGDPGYNCLVSWIGGAVATPDCAAAAFY